MTYPITVQLSAKENLLNKNATWYEDEDEFDNGLNLVSFELNLTLLHIIILSQMKMSMDEWMKFLGKFSIDDFREKLVATNDHQMKKIVTKDESWIFDATCFHLAAKFNPMGLHMLLSYLKKEKKNNEELTYPRSI